MDNCNNSSFSEVRNVILEPNSEYTFIYDDFELKIKTNKFTAITVSPNYPQFNFHPIDKSPSVWTKTN